MAIDDVAFDLIVVGGGLVGASLARAARGLSVALLAGDPPAAVNDARARAFDSRIYAITPGNAEFLDGLKAWAAIPESRRTPVYVMRVHGDDGRAVLEFDALRAGVPELAWIVENGVLQSALWNALQTQENLRLLTGLTCRALDVGPQHAELRLSDGRVLQAQLVAGADGAQSFVRASAGLAVQERSYGQTAVSANFACTRPHRNVAHQWFQGGPVLALLPLPGDHVSMVWSVPDMQAERLCQLDAQSLCREVALASAGVLGEFSLVTPPRSFPLRDLRVRRKIAPRVALIGDAAHVIHPLAGQGANLGLQDARVLAAVLGNREPGRDAGDLRMLRRYERARAEPVLAMRTAVNGLFSLFGAQLDVAARVRNAGLNFTDRLPILKNLFARYAAS